MLQIGPRYRTMNAADRSRFRKELKTQLIALAAVYLGFTTWWILVG